MGQSEVEDQDKNAVSEAQRGGGLKRKVVVKVPRSSSQVWKSPLVFLDS